MSLSNEKIVEVVNNLYDYICEDTKLTWNSMYGKFRTIEGRKFLKHVDETLKCGNRMPILFPGEPEPVDIIQWQLHPSEDIRKDPVSFYFSIRPTHSKITVLTHQDGSDSLDKWVFEKTGEFCYNWEKDAWIAPENIRITKNIGIILDTLDLHKDLKTVSYFVSGKCMTFIEGHQSPTGGFDEYVFRDGDEWLYFHSTKNTSLTTKKGLNSTQLHLNHVRRIQVD
jgi:hypothetical protein